MMSSGDNTLNKNHLSGSELFQFDHELVKKFRKSRYVSKSEGFILLGADVFIFALSFYIAHFIRFYRLPHELIFSGRVLLIFAVYLSANYIFDLYRTDSHILGLRPPGRSFLAVGASGLILAVIVFLLGQDLFDGDYFGRGVVFIFLVSLSFFSATNRWIVHRFFGRIREKMKWLMLGDPGDFGHVLREIDKRSLNKSFTLLSQSEGSFDDCSVEHGGDISKAVDFLSRGYDGVILSPVIAQNKGWLSELMKLRLAGVRIFLIADYFETIWFKVPVYHLEDHWFATSNGFLLLHDPVGLKIKRVFDIVASFILFILTLPLMLITSVLIKLTDGGPIFYKQIRTGEKGRDFSIIKFRSMRVDAEKSGAQWAKKNDSRITLIGKFIRLTRIDELPQLINVFKGEMSFIGPRPERPEFNVDLEKEIPYYSLRHLVKPGITGWAQVMYPYGASKEDAKEKLEYDLYYIKNCSLLLDFAIILKTIRVILLGKGR
jgi:exopolysaccharide biosynthesis polyprenyl glycosylphosphotransferase